ncbi:MAG TPA: hypothetical protein VGE92_14085 [Steroidobacteraceae bacterium]
MATPSPEGHSSDQRFLMDVGLVSWSSFLAACVASILFFAAVDPQLLRDAGPRIFDNLSREAGYALGFFFFWMLAASAAGLSVYMVRSAEWHDGHPDTERDSD